MSRYNLDLEMPRYSPALCPDIRPHGAVGLRMLVALGTGGRGRAFLLGCYGLGGLCLLLRRHGGSLPSLFRCKYLSKCDGDLSAPRYSRVFDVDPRTQLGREWTEQEK